jgi:O-acetyl-ADP-ribose deacetylase (regulator of RNase III)
MGMAYLDAIMPDSRENAKADCRGKRRRGRMVTMSEVDRIELVREDITALDVDAIVNAANERMLGGGGVDGAIHRAAGPGLLAECRGIPEVRPGVRCPTGEARITSGGNLRARYVIHTVGPVWRGGREGEPTLLASCYRSVLEVASANDVRSIAFPAISCGVYGYPIDEATRVAVDEVSDFLSASRLPERIVFCAFSQPIHDAYCDALSRILE